MSPEEQILMEGNKLLHGTLTQLVTISSGSLLILIALKEKLFPNARCQWLLAFSFAGFFGCILASLLLMRDIALNVVMESKNLEHNPDYLATKWSFPFLLLSR